MVHLEIGKLARVTIFCSRITMNVFRVAGDALHLLSFAVLIWKIRKQRSCAGTLRLKNKAHIKGISLKTQYCYFLVFVCRYLDLPWNLFNPSLFHFYLASMKAIFIASTAAIIYYVSKKYKSTYNADEDQLPLYYLIPPCLVLSLFVHEEFSFFEVLPLSFLS